MANNQNVNKVVYAGSTLIDLTGDDVTAGDVLSGKKFHLASGAEATGTMPDIGAISGILKGDGNGGVSAATAGTDYVTPTQSLALGLTGASVGDLVRVNSVDSNGKPTSWKKVPLNEIKCNKNLLDNWYFVGGGSQLGDGVFPINQRGQTTYQNFDTSIDRWKIDSRGNLTVALESDGISLTEQGTENVRGYFDQRIVDKYEQFVGKTLTATILLSNNTLITGTCVWNKGMFAIPGNGNVQLRLYWYVDVKQIGFTIDVFHNKSEKIRAAKFELGSEQTLAHNEGTEANPIWVLNEIPDYGEELAKCQRYFIRNVGHRTAGYMLSDIKASIMFPTPVPMAKLPIATIVNNGNVVSNGTYHRASTFDVIGMTISGVRIDITLEVSIPNSAFHSCTNADCLFDFSCEP